jgi:hypothetical protein
MLRSTAALAVTALLAGCGSLCARADAAAKAFTAKAMPCEATTPSPRFDRQACEASMGQCSAQDAKTIDAYFDCLEKLPACDPAASAAFSAAVLACADPMQGVSAGCFAQ